MRWTKPSLIAVALMIMSAVHIPSGSAAEEKRITVYSTAANYSLPVAEQNGHDYVGLLEILEPLGQVSAQIEGMRWKFRYQRIDAEFVSGRARARIRGKEFDLPANFLLDKGRGLVPLSSLSTLLARFLGGPVTFHETARRLFVGSVGAQFSAEIRKTMPPQLVLNFSSPVNPTISTEPGKLRMVFNREPLVNAGTQTFAFPDKTIPFATYQENNGAAEITVSGTAPLMASFSGDRRTITILAAVSAAQAPAQVQPTAPASTPSNVPLFNAPPENPAPGTTNIPGGVPTAPVGRRFLAVVDASHGGDERGAALTGSLPEKDVTLAVARRLRQELENRGVGVLMLRDSDVTLGIDQRAAATNMAHPAVYIGLHASTQGNGVRLYTAVLPSGWEGRGSFLGWETAQSSALAVSQAAVTGVAVELQRKRVPVRSLAAPLRPLNNITVAAMAVEVAPPGTDVLEVASPNYEQLVASAIANGVAQLRDRQGFPQ